MLISPLFLPSPSVLNLTSLVFPEGKLRVALRGDLTSSLKVLSPLKSVERVKVGHLLPARPPNSTGIWGSHRVVRWLLDFFYFFLWTRLVHWPHYDQDQVKAKVEASSAFSFWLFDFTFAKKHVLKSRCSTQTYYPVTQRKWGGKESQTDNTNEVSLASNCRCCLSVHLKRRSITNWYLKVQKS